MLWRLIQILACINNHSYMFDAEQYYMVSVLTMNRLTIHPGEEVKVVSSVWWLWIELLWLFMCRFCVNFLKSLFLWCKCSRVQLLGHMMVACLVFEETAKWFFSLPFYIPISKYEPSSYCTSSQAFGVLLFIYFF